ncbi:MAG: DNA repair protein RecN [Akkermansia sp.]|nr:DNA repair protein RecN [Akkermansia sp.]
MLTLLKIKNLALVDQLLWEPCSGFICITGETGAGKSVIIGSIRLALGERADKTLIRNGEQQASIEAIFHLPKNSPVHHILASHDIPPCEENNLFIKRIISTSANRQFINDSPCTLNLLRDVGAYLVDMHGPNDHRSLLSQDRQLSLLDAYGEHSSLVAAYSEAWQLWQHACRDYEELVNANDAGNHEIELLHHQINEINNADFSANEVATLDERWQRARNGSRIQEQVARMMSLLNDNEHSGINSQFHDLARCAHDLERLDSSTTLWLTPIETILVELNELENNLTNYSDTLDSNPEELYQLEERINLFESLKRKYGPEFDDIFAHRDKALQRLDSIENRSERLEELRTIVSQRRKEVDAAGLALSKARRLAAPLLARSIMEHSRELGFAQAMFDVVLTNHKEPGSQGFEDIEFLFGPNPGEPSKPLRLIASSGELARIMLAIKSALADKDATPLLVFDEIDANVGGEVARAVGIKMQQLGSKHQVISITHFPQVAALAYHHYLVQKASSANRTISYLREISNDERISELARMLGGGGKHAITLAEALLKH